MEKKILGKIPWSEGDLVRKVINYRRAAAYHSEHSGFHIETHWHVLVRYLKSTRVYIDFITTQIF
jgi:hypothetical protein